MNTGQPLSRTLRSIRPDYLMREESELQRSLLERYEKVCANISADLGKYYSAAVCKGILVWAADPEKAGRSSVVDEIMRSFFAQRMETDYTNMIYRHFDCLEREAAQVIREELLRNGWDPDRCRTLGRIPLRGFRQYWHYQGEIYIREEVARMVDEFNFWELLDDLPQMPRESRINFRCSQVARLWDPLRRQLLEDRVKLSIGILSRFSDQPFDALYCNQLILSLKRWEASAYQQDT